MTRNNKSKQPGKPSAASAGDVNPASAGVTQFRAPAVAEAADGTVDPADCPDGAHVVTGTDIKAGVGDSVTLTWQGTTAAGQAAAPYTQTKTIPGPFEVNKPVKFDPVPLAQITASAGGKVDVSYTVTTYGGTKTGASQVNTLQVRKQDKPQATFKVRGSRGSMCTISRPGSLVAVDNLTGKPVTAQWKYEGDSQSVTAVRLVDSHPEKTLAVTADGALVRIAPVSIASTTAFHSAARLDDGTVASWGYAGGPVQNSLPDGLATANNIVAIFPGADAFTVLRSDGSMVAWGNSNSGGSMPPEIAGLHDIVSVSPSTNGFVALRNNGSAVAWGSGTMPPDIAALRDIVSVFSAELSFAALRGDGSVVSWGRHGTVPPDIAGLNDIVSITSGRDAFAALRSDGSVVAWGSSLFGGSVQPDIAGLHDIVSIYASGSSFAALRSDGSVVAWGDRDSGGNVPPEIAALHDIVNIAGSAGAFAALRRDGSMVAWGDPNAGGSMPPEIAGLHDVVSVSPSTNSFAAIRSDGSVWAWGVGQSLYMTHSSPTLAVYPFYGNYSSSGNDTGFFCLGEDHRVFLLGSSTSIPKEIQGRVTWTL